MEKMEKIEKIENMNELKMIVIRRTLIHMRCGSGCPWARHFRRSVESSGSCQILPGVWLVSIRSGAAPAPGPLCTDLVALASAASSSQPGAAIGSEPLKIDSGGGASVAFALGSAR